MRWSLEVQTETLGGQLQSQGVQAGGRYQVEQLLGVGGMGEVYRALDRETGREVALKRLRADRSDDRLRRLFEREFHTLASLKHPRIVAVHDYGVDGEGAYYTMELLRGEDLSNAAPMPWREACSCLRDVASIVGVLHSRRLVHRDLSPRNLWRTADGRLKLLDFGALSPFGPASEIVGTPPLTAPEAVHSESLDARTDLFALGALGYWLLTGTHAFPARQMAALHALWEHEPTPPSRLVALLKGADEDVPRELDALILSLLRLRADERPSTTMDVIDTLNALAGLAPEAEDVVHRGYLDSSAFVARNKPLARFQTLLTRAHEGQPGCLWIESQPGLGRSRLLSELAMRARLSGALVLAPTVQDAGRSFGLAADLARALRTALPRLAEGSRETHGAALRELLAEPDPRGDSTTTHATDGEGLKRVARLSALTDWFTHVAREQTLVIVVDDVHRADEPSQSLLSTLAKHADAQRLLIVASAPSGVSAEGMSALGVLRGASRRRQLQPFAQDEVRELLASCFGQASNLTRLAARLHVLTEGNPSHVLLLVRHLVQVGAIEYAEGTWVLPFDLPADLPRSLDAGALTLLGDLSEAARRAAGYLVLPDFGVMSEAMLRALPGFADPGELRGALDELTGLGLVRELPEGFRLQQEGVREALLAELSPQTRQALHGRLAQHLAEVPREEPGHHLRTALHWLRAGDLERAEPQLLHAARASMTVQDSATTRACAPHFEEAYARLCELGADDEGKAPTLVALSVAGFTVDGAYAARFGDETRRVLDRVLCMGFGRRVRWLLGRKLALFSTLLVAGLRLRLRGSALDLGELVRWFVSVLSSLSGVAATYVDPDSIQRYAAGLEPFAALGPDHIAGFTYRYTLGMEHTSRDKPAFSLQYLDRCLERLRSDAPLSGATRTTRDFMIGGILYANGVRLNLALREEPLAMAQELETLSPMHAMQAEYLRMGYYLFRGERARAEEHRGKLEALAIRVGSSWQAETTAPTQDLLAARLAFDAVGVKRASQQMARVAGRSRAVGDFQRFARGAYQVLRGRHERAIEALSEANDEPRATTGWALRQGLLAAAYNGLGQHREARDLCEHTLSLMEPGDLDFVMFSLEVQLELAHALAAVDQGEAAREQLDALLNRVQDRGPLVRGYVHRACARVAVARGDHDGCAEHLDAMQALYAPLRIPSLHAELASLRRELQHARDPDNEEGWAEVLADDAHLLDRVQAILAQASTEPEGRAAAASELAVELTHARGCAIVVPSTEAALGAHGSEIHTDVVMWAREQLLASLEDDETETGDDLGGEQERGVLSRGSVRYALSVLWHGGTPVGALVLAFDDDTRLPPDGLRRALASCLSEVQSGSQPA